MRCPGCQGTDAKEFFDGGEVPVFANVLHDSREAALAAPRARFRLALCPACGLIANPDFDPDRVRYAPAYENALHFSPRFLRYAEDLAARLADRYDLAGRDVIEIGCGDGHFLDLLCRTAGARGTGFDPSHDPGRSAVKRPGVDVRTEPYSADHAEVPADLVVARHLLEHVPDPVDLLRSIRAAIGDRPGTGLYVEVPNGSTMLARGAVWDLIYEHATYFTPASLAGLVARAGLEVVAIEEPFDGQFLAIHARAGAGSEPATDLRDENVAARAREFAARHRAKVDAGRTRLDSAAAAGQQVVAWGAGSKGVAFLNAVPGAAERIAAIVDLNPRKRGRFVAGAGTPIVSPDDLRDLRPDLVLVMNPIYTEEIAAELASLGLSPRIEPAP